VNVTLVCMESSSNDLCSAAAIVPQNKSMADKATYEQRAFNVFIVIGFTFNFLSLIAVYAVSRCQPRSARPRAPSDDKSKWPT
jgi:hypothetical protein